jgi:hypothetical protein
VSVLNPRWQEILLKAQDLAQERVNTSLAGVVVSYDAGNQTCSARPAVWVGDGEIPPLEDVPVVFMSGGGCDVAVGLSPGDEVQLIFSQYDDGAFLTRGDPTKASNLRMHGMYARAIPCRLSDPNKMADAPPPGEVHISSPDRTKVVVKDGEINLGGSASDFAALASKVDANFDAISQMFSGWLPVPNDGGAELKTASASLIFDPVGASVTKVE